MMVEWPALALYWYAPATGGGVVSDPIFGKPLNFFSAGTARLAAHRRLAAYSGCDYLCAGRFFILITAGAARSAGVSAGGHPALARAVDRIRVSLAILAARVYLSRFELLLGRSHDLRRRDLHGRARHADRVADCLRRADIRRAIAAVNAVRMPRGLCWPLRFCRLRSVISPCKGVSWYRQQLYRQTE